MQFFLTLEGSFEIWKGKITKEYWFINIWVWHTQTTPLIWKKGMSFFGLFRSFCFGSTNPNKIRKVLFPALVSVLTGAGRDTEVHRVLVPVCSYVPCQWAGVLHLEMHTIRVVQNRCKYSNRYFERKRFTEVQTRNGYQHQSSTIYWNWNHMSQLTEPVIWDVKTT